jgi:hypothetical protein
VTIGDGDNMSAFKKNAGKKLSITAKQVRERADEEPLSV